MRLYTLVFLMSLFIGELFCQDTVSMSDMGFRLIVPKGFTVAEPFRSVGARTVQAVYTFTPPPQGSLTPYPVILRAYKALSEDDSSSSYFQSRSLSRVALKAFSYPPTTRVDRPVVPSLIAFEDRELTQGRYQGSYSERCLGSIYVVEPAAHNFPIYEIVYTVRAKGTPYALSIEFTILGGGTYEAFLEQLKMVSLIWAQFSFIYPPTDAIPYTTFTTNRARIEVPSGKYSLTGRELWKRVQMPMYDRVK